MQMRRPPQQKPVRLINDKLDISPLGREFGSRQRQDAGERGRMGGSGEDQSLPLRSRRRLYYQTPQGPIDGVEIFSPGHPSCLPVPSEQNKATTLREPEQ